MNKGEIARQYFLNGYNCAQAVALAFCDELALPPETPLGVLPEDGAMRRPVRVSVRDTAASAGVRDSVTFTGSCLRTVTV